MAFYGILFAILFLGAFRELIRAFGESNWPDFWMAATLTVVIFNDVLYTSHFIELKPADYTIVMKINDLIGFLLLSVALLALAPSKENIFGADAGDWFKALPPVRVFWGILSCYWLTVIAWNLSAGYYAGKHRISLGIHSAFLLAFLAMLLASFQPRMLWINTHGSMIIFALLTFWACVFKPILFRQSESAG